jgi:predicted ArsR family transcriptional regulator
MHSGEAPLKPTAAKVLSATFETFEVGGVPEVAEVLGITAETVKTHLRCLFQKTGASRRLHLAKIVAGFSNPLLS